MSLLTLLHSALPKLYGVLAILSVKGLKIELDFWDCFKRENPILPKKSTRLILILFWTLSRGGNTLLYVDLCPILHLQTSKNISSELYHMKFKTRGQTV